ncbi:FecR family protein [Achromobacter marplatensis]|jgi:transmembrane sensor|uniref:FecR family protein n=1 Tax=Achromobacter marplatensis TaxID=470868 RepID=UPI003C78D8E3
MTALDARTREAAIEWQVCLSSGQASDADRAAFAQWLAESPSHGAAWQRLNAALNGTLHALRPGLLTDGDALRRSLVGPQLAQRRRLGKLALAGGALLLGAGVADRYVPLQSLAAGYVTRTGERRRVALPDGNTMELDARSAASWEGPHTLRVSAGAAIFEVGSGQGLQVRLPQGEVRLGQGRAMVRCEAERSFCLALSGAAEVMTLAGARQTLAPGQGVWFDARQVNAVQNGQEHAAAWQNGELEVHDEPLQTVVEALGRYRPGWLRMSPQAARLRVTGLFPLDDGDRALEALRNTLPIRLQRLGRWYVMIDLA